VADLARVTRCKQRAAGGFLPRPPGTLVLAHTPRTPSGPPEAFLYHNPTIILYHLPPRVKVLLVGIRMAAIPGVCARASPTSSAGCRNGGTPGGAGDNRRGAPNLGTQFHCVLAGLRRLRRAGTWLESPVSLPRGIGTISLKRGSRRCGTCGEGRRYVH